MLKALNPPALMWNIFIIGIFFNAVWSMFPKSCKLINQRIDKLLPEIVGEVKNFKINLLN